MTSTLKTLGLILLAAGCLLLAARFAAHPQEPEAHGTPVALGSDAPPGVRFVTVALGGFRGLLADVLWVRAADLQEQGSFFEVAQLAEWITRLEPRYPEVWSYHAWNMAYNITAVVPDPRDRWHWVQNGVRMLRNQGIPSNPGAAKLYWELGWLFYDKVGGRWDEATLFYRVNWAMEMSARVGDGMLRYEVVTRNPDALGIILSTGLDPRKMETVDGLYGPLDWRLPESQVVYWGAVGRSLHDSEARWCDRLLWMGLTETMKQGYLVFRPERKIYQQAPRLDIAMKGVRRCRQDRVFDDPLVGLAAARFLREAVVILYAFGRPQDAAEALAMWEQGPGGEKAASLDDFVRSEVFRVEALSPETRLERVVGLRARCEIWRRLNVGEFSAGYERLARLHWEALKGADPKTPDWETIMNLAAERAQRELP